MPDPSQLLVRVSPLFSGLLLDLGIQGGSALLTLDTAGNLKHSGTVSFGGGTTITGIVVYAPNLTPVAAAASIGFSEQTFTVAGLATNDKVIVNGPAPAALIAMVAARVSAANTLALTFFNATAAANTPAAGVYTVIAIRS